MLFSVITLALYPLLATPIILSSKGSSAWSADWVITNSPTAQISGTTDTVPYQYIEVLNYSSGLMRLKYNFT